MSDLPQNIADKIEELALEGNALADAGDHKGAWNKYLEALNLIPGSKMDHSEATWLLASMGDMAFALQKFDDAQNAFHDAEKCPGGLANAFINLRLGQTYFELGDEKRAAHYLTLAYMSEGPEFFQGDDIDPKYFQLLERVLKPPAGQSHL